MMTIEQLEAEVRVLKRELNDLRKLVIAGKLAHDTEVVASESERDLLLAENARLKSGEFTPAELEQLLLIESLLPILNKRFPDAQ